MLINDLCNAKMGRVVHLFGMLHLTNFLSVWSSYMIAVSADSCWWRSLSHIATFRHLLYFLIDYNQTSHFKGSLQILVGIIQDDFQYKQNSSAWNNYLSELWIISIAILYSLINRYCHRLFSLSLNLLEKISQQLIQDCRICLFSTLIFPVAFEIVVTVWQFKL